MQKAYHYLVLQHITAQGKGLRSADLCRNLQKYKISAEKVHTSAEIYPYLVLLTLTLCCECQQHKVRVYFYRNLQKYKISAEILYFCRKAHISAEIYPYLVL
jgi:hypothetical protein